MIQQFQEFCSARPNSTYYVVCLVQPPKTQKIVVIYIIHAQMSLILFFPLCLVVGVMDYRIFSKNRKYRYTSVTLNETDI